MIGEPKHKGSFYRIGKVITMKKAVGLRYDDTIPAELWMYDIYISML